MAIDFTGANSGIGFGSLSAVRNLANKSICAWINADSVSADWERIFVVGVGGGNTDEFYSVFITNENRLYFDAWFDSSAEGVWKSAADLATGAWKHVCVTYNNAAASDPLFYINGSVSATTEVLAPVGVYVTGAGGIDYISWPNSSLDFDGKIADLRVYNRILSAAEVLDIYSMRAYNTNYNGLVFAPLLFCASGMQSFDGVALTSSNKIVDPISGASGTPSGSPAGYGETYLAICP